MMRRLLGLAGAPTGDALARKSNWYMTAVSTYANLTGLNSLPSNSSVTANASSTTSGSDKIVTITLTNTGAGGLENLGQLTCAANPASSRIGCQISNGQLVVTAAPTGLAPGSYLFPVTVTVFTFTLPAVSRSPSCSSNALATTSTSTGLPGTWPGTSTVKV